MTSTTSSDVKEVMFINQDAAGAYESLPSEVREIADARTTILQSGQRLPAKHAHSLGGVLSGISEIRIAFDDDSYRVYFAAAFEKVIYILDAGIKKSPHGKEIPRWQVERLEKRLDGARQHYKVHARAIDARYEARAQVRDAKFISGG